MTILRDGDIKKIRKYKYFLCKNCGCIWEAKKDEYETDTQYNEEYYWCKCPFKECNGTGFEIPKEEVEKELGGRIGHYEGEDIL